MKKVIVTGAAGFIGSNMVQFLLQNTDYYIYAIDNFVNGKTVYQKFLRDLIDDNSNRIEFFPINYKNFPDFPEHSIDIVFHFGALPSVPYSVEHPVETEQNNVSDTLQLIENCRKIKIKRFVFSSSCAVYGNASHIPTNENEHINPLSPYALQKRTIEEYLRLYGHLYGFDSVCLRYFNVYGPNQFASNAYANVISAWIHELVKPDGKLRMDGDGTQSRDFVHVSDVCKANFLLSQKEQKFFGDYLNVGSGTFISINEVKNLLFNLHGFDIPIDYCPSRPGDVNKTQADISKIKGLGFEPKVDIVKGIIETYSWYKQQYETINI